MERVKPELLGPDCAAAGTTGEHELVELQLLRRETAGESDP